MVLFSRHKKNSHHLEGEDYPDPSKSKWTYSLCRNIGIYYKTNISFTYKHLKQNASTQTVKHHGSPVEDILGADKVWLMRIYRSLVRSKLDYGVTSMAP
ncbi:hypothetical protein AVEN_252800-1 [Araneus ventricosus]|uniref:Uncharacterized protein n=1 Tax=Araneus ventricosus TaxID=182803 RepID=A0A4Y2CMB3_ARAVE|nr:hypothetical protein AVEN_252800-1 [Araneus ventricosus]